MFYSFTTTTIAVCCCCCCHHKHIAPIHSCRRTHPFRHVQVIKMHTKTFMNRVVCTCTVWPKRTDEWTNKCCRYCFVKCSLVSLFRSFIWPWLPRRSHVATPFSLTLSTDSQWKLSNVSYWFRWKNLLLRVEKMYSQKNSLCCLLRNCLTSNRSFVIILFLIRLNHKKTSHWYIQTICDPNWLYYWMNCIFSVQKYYWFNSCKIALWPIWSILNSS